MKEFSKTNLKEWEWAIVNDYPEFFITKPSPLVQSYIDEERLEKDEWINLRYGFEFRQNEIWEKEIRNYLLNTRNLLNLLHKSGEDPNAYVYGCIIKEKFGRLTIQNDFSINTNYVKIYFAILSKAEQNAGTFN